MENKQIINIKDIKISANLRYPQISFKHYKIIRQKIKEGNFGEVIINTNNYLLQGFLTLLISHDLGIKEIPVIVREINRKGKFIHITDVRYSMIYDDSEPGCLSKDALNEIKSRAKACNSEPKTKAKKPKKNRRHYKASYSEAKYLYIEQEGKCYICGRHMTLSDSYKNIFDKATIDHIIPKSKGGSSKLQNLALCCEKCNQLKSNNMLSIELIDSIKKQRETEYK